MKILEDLKKSQMELDRVHSFIDRFIDTKRKMIALNKRFEQKKTWSLTIELDKGEYRHNDVKIIVQVPLGVIQQQLTLELNAYRRKLVALDINPNELGDKS